MDKIKKDIAHITYQTDMITFKLYMTFSRLLKLGQFKN